MTVIDFTNTGRVLKPYAPVHLGGGRDASGNRTLRWVRRTRINGAWLNYIDVPLGEAVEQYQVIVYTDNTYAVVALSYVATTQEQLVSAAELITAFGTTHLDIYWSVAQLGALGYGYQARTVTRYP